MDRIPFELSLKKCRWSKTGSVLAAGNNNRLLKLPRAAGLEWGEGRVRKRDRKRKREWAGNVWAGVCSGAPVHSGF